MAVAEVILALVVLFFCLIAGALAAHDLRRRPRCQRCDAPTVIDDATEPAWFPPVVTLVYRCPRCGQVIRRRFVGAWD